MATIRQPRTTEQATELLERFAKLDGEIAAIEADRRAQLSKINAAADAKLQALIEEREAIRAKAQPWWAKAGESLTDGKRKSIELGGCIVGSRAGAVSLAVAGDEKETVVAMRKLRWALNFLRITVSLDKKKILAGLDGPRAKDLAAFGLSRSEGEETFILERVEQGGTLGGR